MDVRECDGEVRGERMYLVHNVLQQRVARGVALEVQQEGHALCGGGEKEEREVRLKKRWRD